MKKNGNRNGSNSSEILRSDNGLATLSPSTVSAKRVSELLNDISGALFEVQMCLLALSRAADNGEPVNYAEIIENQIVTISRAAHAAGMSIRNKGYVGMMSGYTWTDEATYSI